MSCQFSPEIQFEDTTPDGQQITVLIEFENGRWKQQVQYKNGQRIFVQRYINDQDQLETMECANVKATELYKRAN